MQGSLTCTGAGCKAHPLPGPVEDHVEALHHGGAEHQRVRGRRDAESVALVIQAGPHHGLDVKLFKRKEPTNKEKYESRDIVQPLRSQQARDPPRCYGEL